MRLALFYLCCGITIFIFAAFIYLLVKTKRGKKINSSLISEVLWTVVPFIILILLGIPAAKDLLHG